MESSVRGKVMIIEDEAIIAMDIHSIVSEMGHAITGIARTRNAAVEMGIRDKPDLILADIQLADKSSGIDAVNDLLGQFGEIPVIFITAFPERLLTGERPEPAFLISKPYSEDEVRAAVSQAMFFSSTETLQAGGLTPHMSSGKAGGGACSCRCRLPVLQPLDPAARVALELGVERAAEQHRIGRDVEPQQQDHRGAEGAVDLVVAGEVLDVGREDVGGRDPDRQRDEDARRQPGAAAEAVAVRPVAVDDAEAHDHHRRGDAPARGRQDRLRPGSWRQEGEDDRGR